MADNPSIKLAGYSLCLAMPLLAPLGMWAGLPWLSVVIVFGAFPVLGLVVGEDRSLPILGLRRKRALVVYLEYLPRMYALVWMATLAWASIYVVRVTLSVAATVGLTLSLGIGSALAVPTAHELMHRRNVHDRLLARVMAALCLYGHMAVEHFHHHATVGDVAAGETPPRGSAIYGFAPADFLHGLRNSWIVETARLRRSRSRWWRNEVLQDYAIGIGVGSIFFVTLGSRALFLFAGQAIFAVFCFEVITYVHHYGLVRGEGEEPGPHHAWAHHCWIANCLTFNNTFHSDHHLRPETPYYELHAMYGAPRLPASYFTMFCVALVPPLWRALMDKRLDALSEARQRAGEVGDWLHTHVCR